MEERESRRECEGERERGRGGVKEGRSSSFGAEVHRCCRKEVKNRGSSSVCVVFKMFPPLFFFSDAFASQQQQSADSCVSAGHRRPPAGRLMHSCQRLMQLQWRMATAAPTGPDERRTEAGGGRDLWHLHGAESRCMLLKIDGWGSEGMWRAVN